MGTPEKGKNRWIYISLIVLVAASSLYFFLNNGETMLQSCDQTLTVEVREKTDSSIGRILYLVDDKGKEYRPQIDVQGVVIASGRKMRVCHQGVDTLADGNLVLHIVGADNLP
jgi:hypothetical protein